MKIKKATDETNDIDTDLINVNNFFADLIKEIIVAIIVAALAAPILGKLGGIVLKKIFGWKIHRLQRRCRHG